MGKYASKYTCNINNRQPSENRLACLIHYPRGKLFPVKIVAHPLMLSEQSSVIYRQGHVIRLKRNLLRGIPSWHASATAFKLYTKAYLSCSRDLALLASPNTMLKLVVADTKYWQGFRKTLHEEHRFLP